MFIKKKEQTVKQKFAQKHEEFHFKIFKKNKLKKKEKKPLQPNPVSKPQESHPNNRIKDYIF